MSYMVSIIYIICTKKYNIKYIRVCNVRIGPSDVPQILWTWYFLESQGYHITDCIVNQDNKSTILLAENGRSSCSCRTRHINIQYFFAQDKIGSKEISMPHCPTEEMISKYFSKQAQGALFRKFRNTIMTYHDPDASHALDHKIV